MAMTSARVTTASKLFMGGIPPVLLPVPGQCVGFAISKIVRIDGPRRGLQKLHISDLFDVRKEIIRTSRCVAFELIRQAFVKTLAVFRLPPEIARAWS